MTSRRDVRAACSGATPSHASVAGTLVPPATSRAGTARRAIPAITLNTYSAGRRLDATETVALPKSSEVFRVSKHPRSIGARQQTAQTERRTDEIVPAIPGFLVDASSFAGYIQRLTSGTAIR
jgi:hypothetical protein